MDKNTITGLVLIVAILIGYNYFTAPSAEEIAAQKQQQDSIALAEQMVLDSIANATEDEAEKASLTAKDRTALPAAADSIQLAAAALINQEKFGAFAKHTDLAAKTFTVSTPKFKIRFSNQGAKITDVVLADYVSYEGEPVQMFDTELQDFNLQFPESANRVLNSNDLKFATSNKNVSISASDSVTVRFNLPSTTSAKGLSIVYTIFGDRYDIRQEIEPTGIPNFFAGANRAQFDWKSAGYPLEKHLETEKQRCSVFYCLVDDSRDYLSENGSDDEIIEAPIDWIAFKQNFFSSILISDNAFAPVNAKFTVTDPADTLHTKLYTATAAINPTNTGEKASFRWYYGPNDYNILSTYDVNEIDRIIDFGWGIFGWVNKYFIVHVFRMLESINMSYGLIILVLTVLIKLILSPLTYKNFVSSAKMRVLKPEIEAINKRLKNADPMKKQQETMALYRKTGVNPLAGCLPMVFQMPILYAMFRFFPASIELRQESFLWAEDLSAYDSILELGFSIPFYGDHVSLFTLLMCVSTIGYTAMNSGNMVQPQQEGMPNMKVMMYIFPVFMLFFFNNFSAGLSYYYFAANMLSITQMWVIKKYIIDEKKILSKIEKNKEKNKSKGKSKFQQRLEDMAKQRGYNMPK